MENRSRHFYVAKFYFWVWSGMKAFVVKIAFSLLFIALVTSNIVAESRLHKEYKSGKTV